MNRKTDNKMKIKLWWFLILTLVCVILIVAVDKIYRVIKTQNPETTISDGTWTPSLIQKNDSKKTGLYDIKPIVDAYKSGNKDGLDEKQLVTLEIAEKAISQIISDNMTDYEKELAVHDYICLTSSYDTGHLSAISSENDYSSTPYGTLYNRKAICRGYAGTFQMFMDMLDIPCKTISAMDIDGDEHAWNMVELDNEWYYVDVTWDDPNPDLKENRPVRHTYFNVTESLMKLKHVWESTNLPQANSYKYNYSNLNCHMISDPVQIYYYLQQAYDNVSNSVLFTFDFESGLDLSESDTPDQTYDISSANDEIKQQFEAFEEKHDEFHLAYRRTYTGSTVALEVNILFD